jgi:ribonuclease P protein component
MLPKTNRADKKTIDRIFSGGKFINSPALTFKYIFTEGGTPRISFIAPKSVAKLAVKRNSLRRRGYDILRRKPYRLPAGIAGVFIFKSYENNAEKLGKEIEAITSKIPPGAY